MCIFQAREGDLLCLSCFNNMQLLPEVSPELVNATIEKVIRNEATTLKRKDRDEDARNFEKTATDKNIVLRTGSTSNGRTEASKSKRKRGNEDASKVTPGKDNLPRSDSQLNGRNATTASKRKDEDKNGSDSAKATLGKEKLPRSDASNSKK